MAQGIAGFMQDIGLAPTDAENADATKNIVDPNAANYDLFSSPGYADAAAAGQKQNDALGLSSQLANGQGPSVARAQMNNALAQGNANLSSQSAGLGTANQGGLGVRNLLQAQAAQQAQAAGQGAVAGAAEQVGNIQNYGNLATAARGQGLQVAETDTTNKMAMDDARMKAGLARAGLINTQNTGATNAGLSLVNTGVQAAGDITAGLATGGASALLKK